MAGNLPDNRAMQDTASGLWKNVRNIHWTQVHTIHYSLHRIHHKTCIYPKAEFKLANHTRDDISQLQAMPHSPTNSPTTNRPGLCNSLWEMYNWYPRMGTVVTRNTWTPEITGNIHINGLVHERHNSSELAMELRLSCTNPLISYLMMPTLLCWIYVNKHNNIPVFSIISHN